MHGPEVEWLHANERPSPAFTAALAPPRGVPVAPAVRHLSTGRLVPPGVGQANVMAGHYAGISSAPASRDVLAEALVFDAVTQQGPHVVADEVVAQLGCEEVGEHEVLHAVKRSPPGKGGCAAGVRGGWRTRGVACRQAQPSGQGAWVGWHPRRRMPCRFTEGQIISLHKGGDVADPGNYRPITLLNADYRMLAKLLTNRLLPVAGLLVSREQSAFLPGRHIGEGIMLMQLLPHALAADGQAGGLAVFLDFAKAYDTVSRPFLLELLRRFGLGPAFVKWVSLLLADTKATAIMSGFTSDSIRFEAGVRQGCPLAPVLYLFVAEALLRFLKHEPHIGISVAGMRLVAQQFADDTKVFLRRAALVGVLLTTMSIFARASGQHLNIPKCSAMPVGPPCAATPPQGSRILGVPVKHGVDSHGFSFAAFAGDARPSTGWDSLVAKLHAKFVVLARMPLSAFGRAAGATAYALSCIMYLAEFCDTLPAAAVADLPPGGVGSAFADRGCGPAVDCCWTLCVAARVGGVGAQPLAPTPACHAMRLGIPPAGRVTWCGPRISGMPPAGPTLVAICGPAPLADMAAHPAVAFCTCRSNLVGCPVLPRAPAGQPIHSAGLGRGRPILSRLPCVPWPWRGSTRWVSSSTVWTCWRHAQPILIGSTRGRLCHTLPPSCRVGRTRGFVSCTLGLPCWRTQPCSCSAPHRSGFS